LKQKNNINTHFYLTNAIFYHHQQLLCQVAACKIYKKNMKFYM